MAIITTPSTGWTPTRDVTLDDFHHRAVYISLRTPNPGYPLVPNSAPQNVSTAINAKSSIKIYLRSIAFDAQLPSEEPYFLAAEATGNSATPAGTPAATTSAPSTSAAPSGGK